MKQLLSKHPPLAIARSGSLLRRLQTAPGAEDQPYLDQLMTFLETPPPEVRDRWKEGAEMCTTWGVPCTGASVWRLYRSCALAWRLRLANEAGSGVTESGKSLDEKTSQMVALRTFEVLANPETAHASLIGFARIEYRKKALEFARRKYDDNRRAQHERTIAAKALAGNFLQQFAPGLKPAQPGAPPST